MLDTAAAVSIIMQYSSNPSKEHWMAVKCIFGYIKGTLNFGLKFSNDDSKGQLYGFSDTD